MVCVIVNNNGRAGPRHDIYLHNSLVDKFADALYMDKVLLITIIIRRMKKFQVMQSYC